MECDRGRLANLAVRTRRVPHATYLLVFYQPSFDGDGKSIPRLIRRRNTAAYTPQSTSDGVYLFTVFEAGFPEEFAASTAGNPVNNYGWNSVQRVVLTSLSTRRSYLASRVP